MAAKGSKKIDDKIREYASEISEIKQREGKSAKEDNFRSKLENLLNEVKPSSDFVVIHEKTQAHGTPDFTVETSSHGTVGYIECKNIGDDLEKYLEEAKNPGGQIEKYSRDTSNIILTDYVNFYLLTNNERDKEMFSIDDIDLDLPSPRLHQLESLKAILNQFFNVQAQKITKAENLAEFLVSPCRDLRTQLNLILLSEEQTQLIRFRKAFERILHTTVKEIKLADVLAETIIYGLFSAKLYNPEETVEISKADALLPKSFEIISEILEFLRKLDDTTAVNIIERAARIVNNIDTEEILKSMTDNSHSENETDDPYVYFYETFLSKYDPELRKERGVYYTPAPVVKFIVRAIDDVLKANFDYSGLDDKRVTLLDFATGTGTFLIEIIRKIFEGRDEYWRNDTGLPHIMDHIHGFEYLIAPYTLAHLKLTQFLSDNGVTLPKDRRLSVYLTNTLEQTTQTVMENVLPNLSTENELATNIKRQEILVVTGNPPYFVKSRNKGEWITNLLRGKTTDGKKYESYYEVDGEDLNERKQTLGDDYVKFIRFAQHKMEQCEQGVVAVITNHAFLDNPTFRGMRQSLLNTFDKLYFLDLHGSVRRRDTAPNSNEDENVFDGIQQGVAISVFIKKPGTKKGVFHADLYGPREYKYKYCGKKTLHDINWKELKPIKPLYLFVPRSTAGESEYKQFQSLNDIFIKKSSGVETARDEFALAYERSVIEERIADMTDTNLSDYDLQTRYDLTDKSDWKLHEARQQLQKLSKTDIDRKIRTCLYRPFDLRYAFYGSEVMHRIRGAVMRHMTGLNNNLALASVSRSKSSVSWQHVFITDKISERCSVSNRGSEVSYVYPLWLYDERGTKRTENLKPEFREWIDARYGKKYEPEQILGCIYATLHSSNYRKKYVGFLKYDFPRVPFPETQAEFERLSEIGAKLMDAHLLKNEETCELIFDGKGDGIIQNVRYDTDEGLLYINRGVYISGISKEVFNFQIGGYKPLDKYLKSRKGRKLSSDEQETLKRAATAIARTIELQCEIDGGAPK